MAEFSARLLEFPVRTAAVDTFVRELRARRIGDIAALQSVINDSQLWSVVFAYWREREWITPAPHSPMYVFPGPAFTDDISVREFCGEEKDPEAESEPELEGPFTP